MRDRSFRAADLIFPTISLGSTPAGESRSPAAPCGTTPHPRERGVTLLETMIAAMILLVAISALMNLLSYAVARSKNQGEVSSMDTALCASKMERLMALGFTDPQLCGTMAANATCGSIYPSAPTTNYFQYFDGKGNSLGTNPVGATYMRQWMVSTGSDVNAKTISISTVGPGLGQGGAPYTVVVAVRANF